MVDSFNYGFENGHLSISQRLPDTEKDKNLEYLKIGDRYPY